MAELSCTKNSKYDIRNYQVCLIPVSVTVIEAILSPYAHFVCMRSKAWLAARVSLRLADMPHPAQARHSHRLRVTLAAAPVPFANVFGPCHMEKTYRIGGNTKYRKSMHAVQK